MDTQKPPQRAGGYRIDICTVFIHMKKAAEYLNFHPRTFQMSRKK